MKTKNKVQISIEKLAELGAHLGHQTRRWNPKMEEYLYGDQDGVHIFDLIKTKDLLKSALLFMAKAVSEGKSILLVCTKKQLSEKTKETAQKCGIYCVNQRWLGGTLTNFDQIKKSLGKMDDLKEKLESGLLKDYTKKEKLLLQRETERLERFLGGLRGIEKKPDILFIVDAKREKTAVDEASKTGVDTVAIVDSNSDPSLVDYPIPMNDDSVESVSYVLDLLSEVILLAKSGKKLEIE